MQGCVSLRQLQPTATVRLVRYAFVANGLG
jgi:hypothetical protein